MSAAMNLFNTRYQLHQTLISDHMTTVNFTQKEDNFGGSCINKGEKILEDAVRPAAN